MKKYWMSIVCFVAILVLNVIKLPRMVSKPVIFDIEFSLDKFHHVLAYLVFAIVMAYEIKKNHSHKHSIWTASAVAFGVGVAMEIIQHIIPYRTFNPMDILANGVGVCMAIVVCTTYSKLKSQKP